MAAQDKVQGIEDGICIEDVRISSHQEIMFIAEALNVPAGSPYRGPVRHAIRRFFYQFGQIILISLKRLPESL